MFNELRSHVGKGTEERFAISGFNFNDRSYRGMIYGACLSVLVRGRAPSFHIRTCMRTCMRMYARRCTRATLRALTSVSEFIWHGASNRDPIRTVPIDDRPRARQRYFRTIGGDPPLHISPCSVPSFLDMSCVLFAYFVLRTRRARPSHFRHVCLRSSVSTSGRRCNPVPGVRIFPEREERGETDSR